MATLDGRAAVVAGATAGVGMAPAGAKLSAGEGAHVFTTGRRRDVLDEAGQQTGRSVTGVRGDAGGLDELDHPDELDRLCDTLKREKGSLDVP